MKKWIVAAAMLAAPLAAGAQVTVVGQDYEYSVSPLVTSANRISGVLLVRNTFQFDPNRFFSILQIGIGGGGGIGAGGSPALEGRVNTAVLGNVGGGQDFQFQLGYFACSGGNPGSTHCAEPAANSLVNGLGLLGCSVPIIPETRIVDFYAGQTCAASGFDGWLRINFSFDYVQPVPPPMTSANVQVSIVGRYENVPSYFVTTPEPATYALMTAGLLAIGVAVRRRRLM